MMHSVLARLRHHAATRPDQRCWRFAEGKRVLHQLSWKGLCRRAEDWACALETAGTASGDSVFLFLPAGPELPAAFFGAMMIGAVPSIMAPPTPKQSPEVYWDAHHALFAQARPAALIAEAMVAARLTATVLDWPVAVLSEAPATTGRPRPHAGGDDAIALVQYSSGTTGLKKGVPLSHRAIAQQCDAYAEAVGLDTDDRVVSWLPLYHDMGLVTALLLPVYLGAETVQLDPFAWAARPQSLFDAIESFAATYCWLPNFAFEHLLRRADAPARLSSLKAVINCSEPCKATTFDHFTARFATTGLAVTAPRCTYAMAETVFAVTHTVDSPARITVDPERLREQSQVHLAADGVTLLSSGCPIKGVDVQIRANDGSVLADGQVGEIAIRAPFLFNGYAGLPAVNRDRLRDGWFLSRDRGFVWHGEVFVLGRLDDMLICNGRNVHAHELEALAARCPLVVPGRCAAFAIDNGETGGTDLVLVAETADPARDGASLRHQVRQDIYDALGVLIQRCQPVAPGWIVKTTSGKISREANQRQYLEQFGRQGHTP